MPWQQSRYAQALAESLAPSRVMLATAQAFDDEMRDRIGQHQSDRDETWRTIESPIDIGTHLEQPGEVVSWTPHALGEQPPVHRRE